MKRKIAVLLVFILIELLLLSSCRSSPPYEELNHTSDLILYTPLSKSIYRPIIKEYQDRNDIWIEVHEESEGEILRLLQNDTANFSCDIILGITQDALDANAELLDSYSAFITSTLVIIYNTNVVTYRELPVGFHSLTEPHWKNQIGFVNPDLSAVYEIALTFAADNSANSMEYQQHFIENINENYAASMDQINSGVMNGHYSVGVTYEYCARSLLASGAEVSYIYPSEGDCIITTGTASLKSSSHLDAARDFLSFTTSNDVKYILTEYMYCNPAEISAAGGDDS